MFCQLSHRYLDNPTATSCILVIILTECSDVLCKIQLHFNDGQFIWHDFLYKSMIVVSGVLFIGMSYNLFKPFKGEPR